MTLTRRYFILLYTLLLINLEGNAFIITTTILDQPDSVYLFAYSRDQGRSGLLLAWSIDQQNWQGIGPHHRFLFSDFGRWGAQKRMFDPYLYQDEKGTWHCIWSLNDKVGQMAHADSRNLIEWRSQSYPDMMQSSNFKEPEISKSDNSYLITWLIEKDNTSRFYQASTRDFKSYSTTKSFSPEDRLDDREEVEIDGETYKGMINKVSWDLVAELVKHFEWSQFHERERSERITDDPGRFPDLEPVVANIELKPSESKEISDKLIGIFFEDISYAADGGLYAELIQNRDFEYDPGDKSYRDETWNSYKSWSFTGDEASFTIDSINPIHPNNKHFALLQINETGSSLVNEGWDGIPIVKGDSYNFSVFARSISRGSNSLTIRLISEEGKNLGETKIKNVGNVWKKFESSIQAHETKENARLQIMPQKTGQLALDMISLFPQNTFKGHKNGLRDDLAKAIEDLNPRFIRFPGGCVAHGDGLENIYRWKNSIGPLESRTPMRNIWGYHQTLGLGYYEYFRFCEDLGAVPVPVLAAGVPCQNSSTGGHGQCGGIPMDEMDEYIQDVLDLIEWANGDRNTEWGRKRAEAGHPEPFNLKYLGIGNEDLITDIFEERFVMIYNAVKEKYPEIIVIGTVGPFYMGTDYVEGWKLADKLNLPMVDEHYYQPPGWFINNQDYYDKYDRSGSKVYLGEYAAHIPGRKMNIETALSEALYLTAVERNADVVSMTSFAPLLAKEGYINWAPDLIYFNNTEVKPTVDYYVQKLYGHNAGDRYIPSQVSLSNESQDVKKRIGVSVVKDSKSGDLIIKLANLLPTEVNSEIDLSADNFGESKALLSVLKGQPEDENAQPDESTINVSKDFNYQMPAYSFSVIRIMK